MYAHIIYRTRRGDSLYDDYLDDLRRAGNKNEAAKIDAILDSLLEYGSQVLVGMRRAEKMNNVWQLRTPDHRVFYFWDATILAYVILHGYRKATNKTPPDQLARAERYMKDFIIRRRIR